jgi:hypothetical protein
MTICHVIQVRDLGGNAVLGYQLHFDIEGDSGIVARAYGTACMVTPTSEVNPPEQRRVDLDRSVIHVSRHMAHLPPSCRHIAQSM